MTPPPEDPIPEIGERVRTSLGWSFLNTTVNRVWTFAQGVILAHILAPRDFGVFAVAFLVLTILHSMNELGVSVAIVRWPGDPTRAANTAFTLAIGLSAALYALCFAIAPPLARVLHSPDAVGVLRLVALGVVLDGLSSIPSALLMRSFQQGHRAIADVASFVVAGGVTIGLAASGYGAWSLAWGSLAGNAVATLLIMIFSPIRPRPGWRASDARELVRVGLPLAGSSLLILMMLNVDYVTVGRVLGPVALGFYVLAFNISSWPPTLLTMSIRRVTLPSFAQLARDPEALRDAFTQHFGSLATMVALTSLGLVLLAGPLIRVVYGDRWSAAIPALRFLAILGGVRVLLDFSYDLLAAIGHSRAVLFLQGLWLIALVPTLALGARWDGIRGVGIGHVVIAVGVVAPAYLIVLHHLGFPMQGLFRRLLRPALGTLAAIPATMAAIAVLPSNIGRLMVGGAAALIVFAVVAVPLADAKAVLNWVRRIPATDIMRPSDSIPGGVAESP